MSTTDPQLAKWRRALALCCGAATAREGTVAEEGMPPTEPGSQRRGRYGQLMTGTGKGEGGCDGRPSMTLDDELPADSITLEAELPADAYSAEKFTVRSQSGGWIVEGPHQYDPQRLTAYSKPLDIFEAIRERDRIVAELR